MNQVLKSKVQRPKLQFQLTSNFDWEGIGPFSHCIDQAGLGAFTGKSGRKHYNPPPLTVMWMNFDSPNFPSFCSLSAIISFQTCSAGCPRMFYTVFQKNIKNIKSIMSLIIILVIECLICALPTVKISFTYLYPLRYHRVSLKIDEYPKCHFSANGQFLKTLHKQTGALNSSFSRKKSTFAEQYLAWTTIWIIKKVEKSSSCLKRVKNSLERVKKNYS